MVHRPRRTKRFLLEKRSDIGNVGQTETALDKVGAISGRASRAMTVSGETNRARDMSDWTGGTVTVAE